MRRDTRAAFSRLSIRQLPGKGLEQSEHWKPLLFSIILRFLEKAPKRIKIEATASFSWSTTSIVTTHPQVSSKKIH